MFEVRKVRTQLSFWWHIHVGRFIRAVKGLKSNAPMTNGRTARQDITHAYVNVYVEGIRAVAYGLGHVLAVAVPLLVIAGIVRLFV